MCSCIHWSNAARMKLRFNLRATRCSDGVYCHLYSYSFQGIQIRPLWLSDWFWLNTRCSWGLVPGIHMDHYKYSLLFPYQFPITKLILLICECMCAGTSGHIPRHTSQTSLNNNIIINWLHTPRLNADFILLCLVIISQCSYDLWHNTLSCTWYNLINQTTIILGICVIWSLSRSGIDTRRSYLNKFYWVRALA